MSVILLLVVIGIIVASGFLIAFIWAVRSGQYDDSYSPSVRILFDEKSLDQEANKAPEEEELPNKPK